MGPWEGIPGPHNPMGVPGAWGRQGCAHSQDIPLGKLAEGTAESGGSLWSPPVRLSSELAWGPWSPLSHFICCLQDLGSYWSGSCQLVPALWMPLAQAAPGGSSPAGPLPLALSRPLPPTPSAGWQSALSLLPVGVRHAFRLQPPSLGDLRSHLHPSVRLPLEEFRIRAGSSREGTGRPGPAFLESLEPRGGLTHPQRY